MKVVLGILVAVLLHAAFILFGGIFFPKADSGKGAVQEVALVSDDTAVDKAKDKEKPPERREDKEKVETEEEKPPEAPDEVRELVERSAALDAPALEAASLGALEAALGGKGGLDEFAEALSMASGGRIGGTGRAGAAVGPAAQQSDEAIGLTEIDQKPRCVFQAQPAYPAELRGKGVDGAVTVVFVVDASGRVTNQKVENASHPAFAKPALEAVRQWKFEPGLKGGQRVACKVRITIEFQRS